MHYQTFEPQNDLSAIVKCYWTLESLDNITDRQVVVPDGCMEMIFHYGDLYKQYLENGDVIIQPRCFVIGQLTRPLKIEPTGKTQIFSVRFHPNGFLPLATLPIKEMENRAISLEKLFGEEGKKLEEKMLKANSVAEKIKNIESFLLSRLIDPKIVDRFVKSVVETIFTANGSLSVDALSKQLNTSRRQLERKLSSAIGLSPKQLSKTIRLQAVLKTMLSKNFKNLTTLSYENEYYDQAHFIKDFKEFTGFTPKEFYGDHLKMSSLFYGTE